MSLIILVTNAIKEHQAMVELTFMKIRTTPKSGYTI